MAAVENVRTFGGHFVSPLYAACFLVSTWPSEASDIFGGRHTAESGRGPKRAVFPGKAGFPFGFFENDLFGGPLWKNAMAAVENVRSFGGHFGSPL